MGKKQDETAVERDIRAILQAIAAPPDLQIELYGDACTAHALMGRFEYGSAKALRAKARKPTPEVRAALADLATAFKTVEDDPTHECYSEDYIRNSPLWRAVREAAQCALDAYGWPAGTPLRSTVIQEASDEGKDVPNSRKHRPRGLKPWSDADTTVTYHRDLFAMLDITPVVSEPFATILAEREAALGVTLPPSVVEFFRIRGIFDLYESNSENDSLIGGLYNVDDRTKLRALGTPEDAERGYIRVAISAEGFLTWYVRLDGSDDPPVDYVHSEEECEEDEDGEPIETYHPYTPTFSAFAFDRMTSWRFRAPQHDLKMRGIADAPTDADRRRLGEALRLGPHHRDDDGFADRYFTHHSLVKVSTEDWYGDLKPGQATWEVGADSVEALAELFRLLAPIGTLAHDLKLEAYPEELAAEAEELLAPMQSG
ncbi:MAG: hypothetical protein U0800_00945 [Isosphaeraceae bacterium]